MEFRKKWLMASSAAIVFIVVYILVSVWIMHDVKDTLRMAYLQEASGEELSEGISEKALVGLSGRIAHPAGESNENIQFSLSTGHAWHLFFIGKAYVQYTMIGGSGGSGSNIPLDLTVKLTNGHWKITDAYEQP